MPSSPLDAALAVLGAGDAGPTGEALRLLASRHNVILYGPPGTGKTYAARSIADGWAGDVVHVTFHPSYSYEDFVEGYRPNGQSPPIFELKPGPLLTASETALSTPTLLVIDEINRADVARAFGELITYIEMDKRGLAFTTSQGTEVTSGIAPDLYVLGTMNTADKSVSLLDVALRRRFKFVEYAPDPKAFDENDGWLHEALGVSLGDLLERLNARLREAGVERDRLIGHAMLAVHDGEPESALLDRLRYGVIPLVDEYLFGDGPRMQEVLPGLVDRDGRLIDGALTAESLIALTQDSVAADGAAANSTVNAGLGALDDEDE